MALKIAIVASGSGTNAQAMFDRIKEGRLDAEVVLVVSNRPGARVLDRARAFGAPVAELDHKAFPDRETFDAALAETIAASGAELVVLAGYMRMLTPAFLHAFAGRVINIHPAILPSFPGVHGGPDAQAWGVKITGCTVHFVDDKMDNGAVIVQAAVPANPGEDIDELMNRIHSFEHRIYPQAIQWFAEGRVRVQDRNVSILPDAGRRQIVPDGHWLVWPPLEEGF
ncbi:MAG: phosphoribosylglycinamide formyltransferase [Desulfovibrionaceae bacterium]|nr:phosphoribosylglycinamide formyltransferase [Desulfovibrionaceae bacterium]